MNIKILGLGLAIGCLSMSLASCNATKEQAKISTTPVVTTEQSKVSTTPAVTKEQAKVSTTSAVTKEQAKIATTPVVTTKINPPASIDKQSPNGKPSQKVATNPDPKETVKKIADYTQLIKVNPNDAKAYGDRGIAYTQQKQYTQAQADFQKAATLFQAQKNPTGYQQAMAALHQLKSVMR